MEPASKGYTAYQHGCKDTFPVSESRNPASRRKKIARTQKTWRTIQTRRKYHQTHGSKEIGESIQQLSLNFLISLIPYFLRESTKTGCTKEPLFLILQSCRGQKRWASRRLRRKIVLHATFLHHQPGLTFQRAGTKMNRTLNGSTSTKLASCSPKSRILHALARVQHVVRNGGKRGDHVDL